MREKHRQELSFFLGQILLLASFAAAAWVVLFLLEIAPEKRTLILELLLLWQAALLWCRVLRRRRLRELEERLDRTSQDVRRSAQRDLERRHELQQYLLTWLHQIKTPLVNLRILSESLPPEIETDPFKIELLEVENYAHQAMNYVKLQEAGAYLHLRKIRLRDVLKKVCRRYVLHFREKRVALLLDEFEAEVFSDELWLAVLFEQILNNALKYTEEGQIRISWEAARRELSVTDTGQGIDPAVLPRVFTRGFSASAYRTSGEGTSTGIGLFIVRQTAEKLRCTPRLESDGKSGTRFVLRFPEEAEYETLTKL